MTKPVSKAVTPSPQSVEQQVLAIGKAIPIPKGYETPKLAPVSAPLTSVKPSEPSED